MTSSLTIARTARLRMALAVVSALLAVIAAGAGPAVPARASLTGTDWVMQTLPANFLIGSNSPSFAPVSCVPGTGFCAVIVGDTDLVNPTDFQIEQAVLVTTDGGRTWTPYTGLPLNSSTFWSYDAISCPTTSVCWAAGTGAMPGSAWAQPLVAKSTDGGQTWTLKSPGSWTIPGSVYWANAIDCVSVSTCWIAGQGPSDLAVPFVAATTDGGATWTNFQNLPSFTPYDPNGTYSLNTIWCASALSCVAAGGLNEGDGQAQVISTSDGGATWSVSPDPTLHSLQQLFQLTCLPVSGGLSTCRAAASANSASGPVVVTSTDGGTTWSGQETHNNTGWMSAISCADAQHCWAAGAGTKLGLLGTSDGGSAWQAVMSDTTNEYGQISCATTAFCVATTDGALWVTTDGGGALAPRASAARAPAGPVTIRLPRSSASTAYARTGTAATISAKYRGTASPKSVKAVVATPAGTTTTTVPIGLNKFYSLKIGSVPAGTTKITFTATGATPVSLRLIGHAGPAPTIS
ncbi:MAG: WD40/YVTN/BNR-like repeat-containing protein, partial [Streptosporangiaceae bacterium]